MTMVKDDCVSSLQMLSIKDVKTGRVPRHVAFIMDGNRRYAKNNNMNTHEGHSLGYMKLSETLKWCLELGIPELTAYWFSIKNLKRSTKEVEGLNQITRENCQKLVENAVCHNYVYRCTATQVDDVWALNKHIPSYASSHISGGIAAWHESVYTLGLKLQSSSRDKMKEWGVRVHFTGRLSLLSEEMRGVIARAMIATRHNDKLRLNLAFYYTGRDEISRAASHLVEAVHSKQIKAEDIDETLVSHAMDVGEPELLIRTSGVTRLSDFLLWQVSNTVLYFTEECWPEFSLESFLASIKHFQKYAHAAKKTEPLSETKRQFIVNLETQRWNNLEKFAGH